MPLNLNLFLGAFQFYRGTSSSKMVPVIINFTNISILFQIIFYSSKSGTEESCSEIEKLSLELWRLKMKKIMMSFAILMAVVAASQADARALETSTSAQITKFDFQNASSLSERKIQQGTITVNVLSKSLTLTLNPSFYCPPNLMCAQVMPRPMAYTASNYVVSTGSCGETIYSAVDDRLPVDGLRIALTVVDHSSDTCKYFAPIAMTEITLEKTSPRGVYERHQFEAEALK